MIPTQSKRPWFQLPLGTAILIVLVAVGCCHQGTKQAQIQGDHLSNATTLKDVDGEKRDDIKLVRERQEK